MKSSLVAWAVLARPVAPSRPWRTLKDRLAERSLLLLTALPLILVLAMLAALLLRTRPILATGSIWHLLTGEIWKPFQREFGFYPFIIGTLWVTAVAMVLAVPPSLDIIGNKPC